MHIARQTPQELVVVAGTCWIFAIYGAAALLTLYFAIARHERIGFRFVLALLSCSPSAILFNPQHFVFTLRNFGPDSRDSSHHPCSP